MQVESPTYQFKELNASEKFCFFGNKVTGRHGKKMYKIKFDLFPASDDALYALGCDHITVLRQGEEEEPYSHKMIARSRMTQLKNAAS